MSSELSLPSEFSNVLGQLNSLTEKGKSLSLRASGLSSIAGQSVEGLRYILEKVKLISDTVRGLRSSLSKLNGLNAELQSKLTTTDNDFKSQMQALEAKHKSELEQERAKQNAEIADLKANMSDMSEREKQKALEEAATVAERQKEAIMAAQEEERSRLVSEYQTLNSQLLAQLESIARNQAEVIQSLESALEQDPDQVTQTLSDIQSQVLSLLEAINIELQQTNQPGQQEPVKPEQESSPSLSPSIEDVLSMPEAPTGEVSNQREKLNAPDIDLDELDSSGEPVNENAGMPPSNNTELFEYMLKTLADRSRSGLLGRNTEDTYEQLKGDLRSWKLLSRDPNASEAELKTKRNYVYRLTNLLFNETKDITPKSKELSLQVGGKRKKTRKHKKVHFRTRSKNGGKKRKGSKSHKGGLKKRSKKTLKH